VVVVVAVVAITVRNEMASLKGRLVALLGGKDVVPRQGFKPERFLSGSAPPLRRP
jgi:hypothetical protein